MKYFRINQQVLFRHFGDFGYITDNRNFGYNHQEMILLLVMKLFLKLEPILYLV